MIYALNSSKTINTFMWSKAKLCVGSKRGNM